jgi:hypothetical protein
MGHPIFHLELQVRSCEAELRLNGFPVIPKLSSPNALPVSFAPPVNPYLAGARNTIELTLRAAVAPDGSESPFESADLEMNVRQFEKGDIVEPGAGKMVTVLSLSDELRERIRKGEQKPPVVLHHAFVNEVVDFSAELLDTPPFKDAEAVVDYALHLRDLMATGDVDALAAEYEPTIRVGAIAYGNPYETIAHNTREGLARFVRNGPELDFDRFDLDVRPHCGGRMWGLLRRGGLPFARSNEGRTRCVIYVAPRDGSLRVVR